MSDIHALDSDFNKKNGSGWVKLVFHVPNNTQANNYPGGQISIVPSLEVGEINGLADGTLYEVVFVYRDSIHTQTQERIDKIRNLWWKKALDTQEMLNRKYKFWGITLEKPS